MSPAPRKWVWEYVDEPHGRAAFVPAEETEPVDDHFARECEAFLDGRYLEWAREEGIPVPAWAWFNRVAHGDRSAIAEHACASDISMRPQSLPETAVSVEFALLRKPDAVFGAVQRELLVPLELELMQHLLSPRAIHDRLAAVMD
jgi:hypothetical protein